MHWKKGRRASFLLFFSFFFFLFSFSFVRPATPSGCTQPALFGNVHLSHLLSFFFFVSVCFCLAYAHRPDTQKFAKLDKWEMGEETKELAVGAAFCHWLIGDDLVETKLMRIQRRVYVRWNWQSQRADLRRKLLITSCSTKKSFNCQFVYFKR